MAALVCMLWQCSSEDFNLAENNPKRNNSDFFKHASSGGIANRGGVDYVNILEDYNDEHNFLATMPDQEGMPIWDKMEVVDTETSSGLMIPLSYDDETLSSILFAIIDEGNRVVGVKNFDNNLLKSIVYDKTIDHNFRERLFYTFMYVDNKVFGTTRFTGISTDLFANQKYNNTFGRIEIKNFELSQNVTTNESGKILWVESCYLYPKCSHHGGDNVQCDGCIELCHASSCSTAMVYVETGDYYPPAIPSGGGGGGGPSGCNLCPDYNPPKDDCAMQEVFYRMKPECSGGTGDGGELPLEDPCDTLNELFNNEKFVAKFDTLTNPNVFTQLQEKAFVMKYPPLGTTGVDPAFISIDMPPCSTGDEGAVWPSSFAGITLIMHDHNNEDCNGNIPIKAPSPTDIRAFINKLLSQANTYTGSYLGAGSLTTTSGGNYLLMYEGTNYPGSISWDEYITLNKEYTKAFQDLYLDNNNVTQAEIEKVFLEFMKEKINKPGLSVYRVTKTSKVKIEYDPASPNSIKETPCP